jgi:hypothetical protein
MFKALGRQSAGGCAQALLAVTMVTTSESQAFAKNLAAIDTSLSPYSAAGRRPWTIALEPVPYNRKDG